MAKIGLKYPKYAVATVTTNASGVETETFGTVKTAGRAISADISVNAADAKFYADDGVAETDREFIDGTITMSVDELAAETVSELCGTELETPSGDLVSGENDTAPYVRFGFIVPKMVRGVRKWMGLVFMRVKFAEPEDSYETKGESVTFAGTNITGDIMKNPAGHWKRRSADKTTEADAVSWLEAALVAADPAVSNGG